MDRRIPHPNMSSPSLWTILLVACLGLIMAGCGKGDDPDQRESDQARLTAGEQFLAESLDPEFRTDCRGSDPESRDAILEIWCLTASDDTKGVTATVQLQHFPSETRLNKELLRTTAGLDVNGRCGQRSWNLVQRWPEGGGSSGRGVLACMSAYTGAMLVWTEPERKILGKMRLVGEGRYEKVIHDPATGRRAVLAHLERISG